MRIKALMKYNFSTSRNAIFIFILCYIAATLFSSIINAKTSEDVVVLMGYSGMIDGIKQSYSGGILVFSIFMLVSSLIGAQSETRFLITRSVSRKEIFIANAVFLVPLAAIMSVFQVISIYLNEIVHWIFGSDWRGLTSDVQIMQAPDMNNALVFTLVSFSILLAFGAISYLLGSLLARWKTQTICVLCFLFVLLITLGITTNALIRIIEFFRFMYMDETTGLLIVLKQIVFALVIMLISFPVMRRITAIKK